MADTKISALTAATTPLAGTEVLPIVQSGATVKVSVANLTAGRAVATAGGSFTDNIIQSTAGKGINFTANTNAPGMTSELLNWYEEGTWTPALLFGGGSTGVTYSVQEGLYTRVGRQVTLTGRILLTSKGSSTGSVTVTGVPFSGGANYPAQIVDASDGFLGLTMPLYFVIAFGTLYLSAVGATGRSSVTNSSFTNTSDLRFSMTYFV
jgi:hypothetical protein